MSSDLERLYSQRGTIIDRLTTERAAYEKRITTLTEALSTLLTELYSIANETSDERTADRANQAYDIARDALSTLNKENK